MGYRLNHMKLTICNSYWVISRTWYTPLIIYLCLPRDFIMGQGDPQYLLKHNKKKKRALFWVGCHFKKFPLSSFFILKVNLRKWLWEVWENKKFFLIAMPAFYCSSNMPGTCLDSIPHVSAPCNFLQVFA